MLTNYNNPSSQTLVELEEEKFEWAEDTYSDSFQYNDGLLAWLPQRTRKGQTRIVIDNFRTQLRKYYNIQHSDTSKTDFRMLE